MTRLTRSACEDRDAVVRLLAEEMAVITTLFKDLNRHFVVRALRLLHAQHVRLYVVEPAHQVRHADENRVYVPGSN